MTDNERDEMIRRVAKEVVLQVARDVVNRIVAACSEPKWFLDYFELRSTSDIRAFVDQLTMEQIDDFLAAAKRRKQTPV